MAYVCGKIGRSNENCGRFKQPDRAAAEHFRGAYLTITQRCAQSAKGSGISYAYVQLSGAAHNEGLPTYRTEGSDWYEQRDTCLGAEHGSFSGGVVAGKGSR